MIFDQEQLIKRTWIITKRMRSPELHYTRRPPAEVVRYATNIVKDEKRVVTFAYPASSFVGLKVREVFIAGRIYELTSLWDVLPTILWHLNVYHGDVVIAMANDGVVPWVKKKDPHVELDRSIYSGDVELEVDDVVDAIEKVQWLLLFTGIELDRVAFRHDASNANVLCLKKRRRAQVLGIEAQNNAAEKAAKQRALLERRAKALTAQMQKAKSQIEKLAQCPPKVSSRHRRKHDFSSIMSGINDSKSAAWNTMNGAPIIVSSGGVVATRREVLSGEDD